jgi:hypothetical protein
MSVAVFGDIFVASTLEEAVIDLLKKWFPTYLREVEERLELPVGVLVGPRVYTNRNDFETIAGENMPLCVVISPGLVDEPITRERGIYTAQWQLGVGIAIAAETATKANMLAKIYGACSRAILMQHQDIDGLAIRVDWLDENYEDLPDLENQLMQYRSVGVFFGIEIENVIDKYKGPPEPDQDPYVGYGQVQTVIVDVGRIDDDES